MSSINLTWFLFHVSLCNKTTVNPKKTSQSSWIYKCLDSTHYWLFLQYFLKKTSALQRGPVGYISALLIIMKWLHYNPLEMRYWFEAVTICNCAHNACTHTQFCLQASLLAAIHLLKAEFIHASALLYSKVYSLIIRHMFKCSSGAKWIFLYRGFNQRVL